jgi:CDP-glucose 4,6-dehydratase
MGAQTGWRHEPVPDSIEARTLSLDSQAARRTLRWRDRLPGMAAIAATARWYGDWLAGADMRAATLAEIDAFTASRGGRADA